MQLAQLRLQHVVVVLAASVARHRTARLLPSVVERDDNRVRRSGKWATRIATLLRAALEVMHDARSPRVDPCVERSCCVGGAGCDDAYEVETQRIRMPLRDACALRRRCNRACC